MAKRCFVPVLLGHAIDDDFIRPHHSDDIYSSYVVSPFLAFSSFSAIFTLLFVFLLPVAVTGILGGNCTSTFVIIFSFLFWLESACLACQHC